MQTDFDYIICGGGCSGLSLAVRLSKSEKLKNKKVLIIEKEIKNSNDRTWCFWEKEENYFEKLLFKKWKEASFIDTYGKLDLHLKPYQYKMIRSTDFYHYCHTEIKKNSNFHFVQEKITSINADNICTVQTENAVYTSSYLFDSTKPEFINDTKSHFLLQHFKGVFIETSSDFFDENCATLMDFSIDQGGDCRFFYLLPFSKRKALVEYTIFSEKELDKESEYDTEIEKYLHQKLGTVKYFTQETEKGIIPMTNAPVIQTKSKLHIKIGTAGGLTKASSGYTFLFIQRDSERILKDLENDKMPYTYKPSKKFMLFDAVLLNILRFKKLEARSIFSGLFRKNKCENVLAFLNNESNIGIDLKIMSSVNKSVFLPAAIQEIRYSF